MNFDYWDHYSKLDNNLHSFLQDLSLTLAWCKFNVDIQFALLLMSPKRLVVAFCDLITA